MLDPKHKPFAVGDYLVPEQYLIENGASLCGLIIGYDKEKNKFKVFLSAGVIRELDRDAMDSFFDIID